MPTYVALLRGINVGGNRKIPMSDLRSLLDGLGHADVRTYIQSGNVVFTANTAAPARVRAAIENAITDEFGFDVAVLLRTPGELASAVKHNPFGVEAHVTFLDRAADAKKVKAIDPAPFAPDRFAVRGQEVYLYCPSGYGTTKLNNALFERKLAAKATTRNWRTVTTLLEMATSKA